MKLDAALSGVSLLGLDTAPLIYFIELHPVYSALVDTLFERIGNGDIHAICSVVTLTEVLSKLLRTGDTILANRYRAILRRSRNIQLVSIDAAIAETAAELRARYRLGTPDAFQIATAVRSGAQAFLTNDDGLRRVNQPRISVVSDLEG